MAAGIKLTIVSNALPVSRQSLVLESRVSYLLQSYLLAKSGKSHLQRVKTSYGSTREIESNGQDCISKMMRSRPQDHVSMSPGLCAYNDKICLTIVDISASVKILILMY
jgi:hypothetical protein